jgi:hypothetical protein
MCLRFQFCKHQRVCVLQFLKKSQIRCTLRLSPIAVRLRARVTYHTPCHVVSLTVSLSPSLHPFSSFTFLLNHQQPFLTYRHFSSFSLLSLTHALTIPSLYTLSFTVSPITIFFSLSLAIPSLSLFCFSLLSLFFLFYFFLFLFPSSFPFSVSPYLQ